MVDVHLLPWHKLHYLGWFLPYTFYCYLPQSLAFRICSFAHFLYFFISIMTNGIYCGFSTLLIASVYTLTSQLGAKLEIAKKIWFHVFDSALF